MGASTPGNVPAMTSSPLILIGSGFESFEVTTRARAGETSCELTLWDSTTSLQCKSARGSHRTRHATITAGIRPGTTTDAVSHDQASLSLVHGPPFTPVIGTCDGTCTCDDAGVPACDGTGTCTCTPPYTPVVGTCDGTCTCTTAGTPTCSGTGTCSCHLYPPSTNIPAATSVQVTIHGSSMGSELSTIKARTGGSACESTLWRGTGWVVCKVAQAGHAKTMGLAITVNIGPGIPGTVTEALSFDNPRIYALESHRNGANIKFANLPVLSEMVSITLVGSGFEAVELHPSAITYVVRIGSSTCEATTWKSSSSLQCRVAYGGSGTSSTLVTAGFGVGSVSQMLSFV